MDDLISREGLLDVVENIIKWDTKRDRNRAIHQVRELTPVVDAVEVVTCDICVHHVDDGCLYCTKLGMLCPDIKFYCKYGKRQNYGGCREEEP